MYVSRKRMADLSEKWVDAETPKNVKGNIMRAEAQSRLIKKEFNEFNQMGIQEITEDIIYRVACGVTVLYACKEVAGEQQKVLQILNASSLRQVCYRSLQWKKAV